MKEFVFLFAGNSLTLLSFYGQYYSKLEKPADPNNKMNVVKTFRLVALKRVSQ